MPSSESSKRMKAKKVAEKKASEELRDASMKGLVRREGLSDITQLDDASQREKQAQRTEK